MHGSTPLVHVTVTMIVVAVDAGRDGVRDDGMDVELSGLRHDRLGAGTRVGVGSPPCRHWAVPDGRIGGRLGGRR